mmetsp:Transcript_15062/g.22188  ORF Transcript_15062/g.22188 Transcript_15062/m.22188 type:complete len:479 (-) Transcript_15062:79-1515(-)|eukprot:CAMPEP_0195519332 /NCGR_PEP_ID=MMETSP0794_2-20130614/14578_1 /TAXON_ID=515487 /ORGANISM="Stephanopyxis turris, Strain CCMP 815" /LENGTH=478 /DNA_ID=CAMNT_0040648461 /DNA_START=82 /DNA_END=1518 /DNA_ORIENTATION=+
MIKPKFPCIVIFVIVAALNFILTAIDLTGQPRIRFESTNTPNEVVASANPSLPHSQREENLGNSISLSQIGRKDSRRLSLLSQYADPQSKETKPSALETHDMKILSLGTSQTWGVNLTNRESEAYPRLLSPVAKNLAMRAMGPKYPALCAQSLIGEEQYDIITLEFIGGGQRIPDLGMLAGRLRERFPDAIIIFVKIWYPRQIQIRDQNDEWIYLGTYFEKHGVEDWKNELLNLKQSQLRYEVIPGYTGDDMFHKIVESVGGYVYQMPQLNDALNHLLEYKDWWLDDMHHISLDGHKEVARGVKEVFEHARDSYKSEPRLGTWGEGDQCDTWYTSGQCSLPRSDNLVVKPFDKQMTKFAIDIGDMARGGSVKVNNPFDSPRTLFIGYMVINPLPSPYPRTSVAAGQNRSMILEQTSQNFAFPVHVMVLKNFGLISPGETTLHFLPLEEGGNPFRLTSISIVGQSQADKKIEDLFYDDA